MHEEFRNPGSHNLSASSRFRFTSGDANRHLHLVEANGCWFLHAGRFAEDIEAAFNALQQDTRDNDELRKKVLAWFDENPPVGPAQSPISTHVGPAKAVSAADHTGQF